MSAISQTSTGKTAVQVLSHPRAIEPCRKDGRTGTSRDDRDRTWAAEAALSLARPLNGYVTRAKSLSGLYGTKRQHQMPSPLHQAGTLFPGQR